MVTLSKWSLYERWPFSGLRLNSEIQDADILAYNGIHSVPSFFCFVFFGNFDLKTKQPDRWIISPYILSIWLNVIRPNVASRYGFWIPGCCMFKVRFVHCYICHLLQYLTSQISVLALVYRLKAMKCPQWWHYGHVCVFQCLCELKSIQDSVVFVHVCL